ncbi:hypothetical protein LINPERHAP2_LOCUS140 [Linum perenne]
MYGLCSKGDGCSFSHDTNVKTPLPQSLEMSLSSFDAAKIQSSTASSSPNGRCEEGSTSEAMDYDSQKPGGGANVEKHSDGHCAGAHTCLKNASPHVDDNAAAEDSSCDKKDVELGNHSKVEGSDGQVIREGNLPSSEDHGVEEAAVVDSGCNNKEVDSCCLDNNMKVEAGDGHGLREGEVARGSVKDRLFYGDGSSMTNSRISFLATPLCSDMNNAFVRTLDLREQLRKRKAKNENRTADSFRAKRRSDKCRQFRQLNSCRRVTKSRVAVVCTDFKGPKSLAQIKEEKKRRSEELKEGKK